MDTLSKPVNSLTDDELANEIKALEQFLPELDTLIKALETAEASYRRELAESTAALEEELRTVRTGILQTRVQPH